MLFSFTYKKTWSIIATKSLFSNCPTDVNMVEHLVIDCNWRIPWVPILGKTKILFCRNMSMKFKSNTFWLATMDTSFSWQNFKRLLAIFLMRFISSLPASNCRCAGLSVNSILWIRKKNSLINLFVTSKKTKPRIHQFKVLQNVF